MFALAILIGIYSYVLFALGVIHLLYPVSVFIVTVCWLVGVYYWFRKDIKKIFIRKKLFSIHQKKYTFLILLLLLGILWLLNFLTALAPETAFDALWYHLTIPKIFITNHAFEFIPGGLLYYSVMPKLVDMLYIPALIFGNEITAKLIHFSFGVLSCIALYLLSRRFLSSILSLFVLLIYSSNLVVSWLSGTAYIDLGRTFFEVMALYGFVLYVQEKKPLWLIESAIMLGLAVSSKVIALGSIAVFVALTLYVHYPNWKTTFLNTVKFAVITILVPAPYFIFAFLSTNNPVYPFFTDLYTTGIEPRIFSFGTVVSDFWQLFVQNADPVNPIYLMVFPVLIATFPRFTKTEKLIGIYVFVSLLVWYVTPRSGGGRFILPYLPALSLAVVIVYTHIKNRTIRNGILVFLVLISIITIGYRAVAVSQYLPVIFHLEEKGDYLSKNLNFDYGDFYDTDEYFAKNLTNSDRVLVYGIHNLYYMNFPFVHESYIQSGDEFNYILAPETMSLPDRFSIWKQVYYNPTTHVILYQQGGNTWVY